MNEQKEAITCMFCGSTDIQLTQDEKRKNTKKGHLIGVAECNACSHMFFWIVKVKVALRGNIIHSRTKVAKLPFWPAEEPVAIWLYDKMEENSTKTGRPIITYYEHVKIRSD